MRSVGRCAILGAFVAMGCGGGAVHTPPPVTPVPEVADVVAPEGSFGGDAWGFLQAMTGNGRMVAIRRFPGQSRPRFGHHGEPLHGHELVVYDTEEGTERAVDDLVALSPALTHMVVIDDATLWLVDDTGSWLSLVDAHIEDDGNACLMPRYAAFSPSGTRVGWLTDQDALRVRDLASTEEWLVPADGRLWTGWPNDDDRGAVLIELAPGTTGWPRMGTTLSCWWCDRFALSFSMFGWSGPEFSVYEVSESGVHEPWDDTSYGHVLPDTTEMCRVRATEEEGGAVQRGPWYLDCETAGPETP